MLKHKKIALKMRIRIFLGDRMLGPGKMELLSRIHVTGSLSAAARQMGMSYMRAWKLVQDLNRNPDRPMVEMSRGGVGGGAGKLTPVGQNVLALYQKMEGESAKTANSYGRKIARLLKYSPS